jgi:hypothetical protein
MQLVFFTLVEVIALALFVSWNAFSRELEKNPNPKI